MSRPDELLEYLRRKGCPISRARISEDLRWPDQEVEAVLAVLLRPPARIRCQTPGQYELVPVAVASSWDSIPVPAATEALLATPVDNHPSRAMAVAVARRVPRETINQAPPIPARAEERAMPRGKRKCETCEEEKGNRAFKPGAKSCKDCAGGKAPKPAVRTPSATGSTPMRELADRHVGRRGHLVATLEELRAERDRIDEAIAVLEKLAA